jgi:hypothetical protein
LLAKPTQLNINLSSDRFAMFNKERDISRFPHPKLNSARSAFAVTMIRTL